MPWHYLTRDATREKREQPMKIDVEYNESDVRHIFNSTVHNVLLCSFYFRRFIPPCHDIIRYNA